MVKGKVGSMDIGEIRYRNFRMLVDEEERRGGHGALERVAAKIGKLNNQVSNFGGRLSPGETRRPKAIGNKVARDIEKALGKPRGWMDVPQWIAKQAVESHATESVHEAAPVALDHGRLVRAGVAIKAELRSTGRDVSPEEEIELIAKMYDFLTKNGL